MKATTSAAAVAALASLSFASARVDISSIHRDTTAPIVPGAYIVEIDPKTVGVSALTGGKRSINPHHDLYESLHKRGVNWDVRKEYDDDELFVGASLDLKTEEDLIQVAQTEGVVNIRPVTILPRPIPVKKHILTGADDPELVNGPKDGGSVHFMTGVDKLHKAGYTGKGVKIGVLDSGFDYNHPNLGGGYGAGFKFQYGYDFVGNDYDGGNTPTPDEDPDDSCNGEGSGHGTHVAGSIGGNPGNNPYGFAGVAHEAIMGGYRVFGCTGGVSDDILVEAIMRAYHDGNDIITMSLGGPAGWTASVSSVVSSRVAKAGRIVTIAAGNDGSFGQFYAAGPSSGIEVISVASVDNTVIPVRNAISSDRTEPIPYYSLKALPFNESLPVYAISKEIVPNDGCNPLPDSTPDLSGFMVLIRRGVCPFVQKLENVAAKGARVALIYNNGGSPNAFDGGVIPGALISTEDGAYLLQKFNAGTPPTITFPQDGPVQGVEAASGGLVSTFSTYGPTFDAWMKPSVAAPGGGIVSTMPLEQGGWGIMSGTSMATPYVAGVAALLLEAKGRSKATARAARDILQTTARSIPFSKADGAPYQTVNQQGAGLINAYNAITYTTVVAPGQLLLNDTTHFKERHSFDVKNTGKKAQKYKLSHIPAGTAHTVPAGAVEPNLYPVPLTSEAATVSFSESSFTLRPGQSKQIRVSFAAPKIDPSTIPSYSGWVEVASDSGEVLAVTYMGIASELKKAVVFDNSPEFFGIQTPAVLGPSSEPVADGTTFTFNGTDYPAVLFRLVFGTRALVFDLVKEDLTLPNTINKRGWLSDFLKGWWGDFKDFLATWWGGKPPGSYGEVPIVGPLTQYDWNPRHVASEEAGEGYSVFSLQNNTFANNTAIPNGRYKILARALKVSGDPRKQEDYESWLSPVLVFAKP